MQLVHVGAIERFDAATGEGIAVSREGIRARIDRNTHLDGRLPPNAKGMPVAYTINEAKGGAVVCWLDAEWPDRERPKWPAIGEMLRLICTVAFCNPKQPY